MAECSKKFSMPRLRNVAMIIAAGSLAVLAAGCAPQPAPPPPQVAVQPAPVYSPPPPPAPVRPIRGERG